MRESTKARTTDCVMGFSCTTTLHSQFDTRPAFQRNSLTILRKAVFPFLLNRLLFFFSVSGSPWCRGVDTCMHLIIRYPCVVLTNDEATPPGAGRNLNLSTRYEDTMPFSVCCSMSEVVGLISMRKPSFPLLPKAVVKSREVIERGFIADSMALIQCNVPHPLRGWAVLVPLLPAFPAIIRAVQPIDVGHLLPLLSSFCMMSAEGSEVIPTGCAKW